MRYIIFILILLTFSTSALAQSDTLKFQHVQFDIKKQYGRLSIDERLSIPYIPFPYLFLSPDNKFEFKCFNMFLKTPINCREQVKGLWQIQDQYLILKDSTLWEEHPAITDVQKGNSDTALIVIKNNSGKPLENIQVDCFFPKKPIGHFLTDKNGEIKICKNLIKSQMADEEDMVILNICFSNKKSSRIDMWVTFKIYDEKIDITIIEDPKVEFLIRTTRYKIEDCMLLFIGQDSSNEDKLPSENWGSFQSLLTPRFY